MTDTTFEGALRTWGCPSDWVVNEKSTMNVRGVNELELAEFFCKQGLLKWVETVKPDEEIIPERKYRLTKAGVQRVLYYQL